MKKVLIILIIVSLLFYITNYLLNTVLPQKIQTAVRDFASGVLRKESKISRIKVSIIKGITLIDVAFYDKETSIPLLTAQETVIKPFYPSLIFGKKVISSLTVKNIFLNVVREQNGLTNLPEFKTNSQTNAGWVVQTVSIKNLSINFEDKKYGFKKKFSDISLYSGLNLLSRLNVRFNWQDKFNLEGTYSLKTKAVKAGITFNKIDLAEFTPYLPNLQLKSANLTGGNLFITGEKTYSLKGNLKIDDILLVSKDWEAAGTLDLNPDISCGPAGWSYFIKGTVKGAECRKIPCIDTLSSIDAAFELDKEILKITAIKANLKNMTGTTQTGTEPLPYTKSIKFKNGTISNGNLSISREKPYHLKGSLKIDDILLAINDWEAAGTLDLNPDITCGPAGWSYFIKGTVKGAECRKIPCIDTLSSIDAAFELDKKMLKITSLKASLKNMPVAAQGEIDLTGKQFRAAVETVTELKRFINAAKEIKPFSFNYENKGELRLYCAFTGNLAEKKFHYKADYRITKAEFKNLTDIQAEGSIDNDALILKTGQLKYQNIPFTITGILKNFLSPVIDLSAEGNSLSVFAQVLYQESVISITQMSIGGENSKIAASGGMDLKENTVQIEGSGRVDFKDIIEQAKLFKTDFPIIKKLDPEGKLDIKFNITGGLPVENLILKLAGSSEQMKIYGVIAEKVKLELYKDKQKFIISPLIVQTASGIIDFRTNLDFANNHAVVNITAENIDLEDIRKQLKEKIKNKKLAGKLFMEAYIENDSISEWNKLQGEGWIAIKEGDIWELNLLKGLGEFLFIPDFENIRFIEGYADLLFKKDKVIFDNLELSATEMSLHGAGSIDLNNNLDFILYPAFNPLLISASESLKKITTRFLGKNGLIIEIKGQIQKPSYKMKPAFLSPIKGIKDFFERIFD